MTSAAKHMARSHRNHTYFHKSHTITPSKQPSKKGFFTMIGEKLDRLVERFCQAFRKQDRGRSL
jgi:hypothetical protein